VQWRDEDRIGSFVIVPCEPRSSIPG